MGFSDVFFEQGKYLVREEGDIEDRSMVITVDEFVEGRWEIVGECGLEVFLLNAKHERKDY